jgi:hypothetical protein
MRYRYLERQEIVKPSDEFRDVRGKWHKAVGDAGQKALLPKTFRRPIGAAKQQPRLSPRERELASQTISQEIRTRKYPHPQAVAVGISRARRQAEQEKLDAVVAKYL